MKVQNKRNGSLSFIVFYLENLSDSEILYNKHLLK